MCTLRSTENKIVIINHREFEWTFPSFSWCPLSFSFSFYPPSLPIVL